MKLARTIRLDESDENVFEHPAGPGEWAISGGFEFANWTDENLQGKQRQAFTNGWLSLESGGRATFVAVADILEAEYNALIDQLAARFISEFGAPSIDIARPVALEELEHMRHMCEDQIDNTLLMVSRTLEDVGVHEAYRYSAPSDADLEAFAVHGSVD